MRPRKQPAESDAEQTRIEIDPLAFLYHPGKIPHSLTSSPYATKKKLGTPTGRSAIEEARRAADGMVRLLETLRDHHRVFHPQASFSKVESDKGDGKIAVQASFPSGINPISYEGTPVFREMTDATHAKGLAIRSLVNEIMANAGQAPNHSKEPSMRSWFTSTEQGLHFASVNVHSLDTAFFRAVIKWTEGQTGQ